MTINDMQCFLMVAETLSYTVAAQKLYISQPAITKHISSMEKELNTTLIDRTNKRAIELTPSGEILYKGLKKSLTIYQETVEQIAQLSVSTPVSVYSPKGTMMSEDLVHLFNDFAEEIRPALLKTGFITPSDYPNALNNGSFIICEKEMLPQEKKYSLLHLTKPPVPNYIIASSKHPAFLENASPQPKDFIDCPVFFSEETPKAIVDNYILYLTKLYGHRPDDIVFVDTTESVELLLYAARGITVNSGWFSLCSRNALKKTEIPLKTDFYLVWDNRSPLTATENRLIKKLTSYFK